MTLAAPTDVGDPYLVSTVPGGEGFAPMIIYATDACEAARGAARIWTGALKLFVVELGDFTEVTIERDPKAFTTGVQWEPKVTHGGR